MKNRFIILGLMMLASVSGCNNIDSEQNWTDTQIDEAVKMETAYTFLLQKVQRDNINLIASKDDKNLHLIQNIIETNRLNIDVENYGNIERGTDLCYYSKSTKKAVTIIDVSKRDENCYYVSYYMGPEGGASKEIQIDKKNGKWAVVNDDGMWSVK